MRKTRPPAEVAWGAQPLAVTTVEAVASIWTFIRRETTSDIGAYGRFPLIEGCTTPALGYLSPINYEIAAQQRLLIERP